MKRKTQKSILSSPFSDIWTYRSIGFLWILSVTAVGCKCTDWVSAENKAPSTATHSASVSTERKPITKNLKLIGKNQHMAQTFVTCLENVGPDHDLRGLQDPGAFQQKTALCANLVLDSSAYNRLDAPAALGPYVQNDLSELSGLLNSVEVHPDYRWLAAEPQAYFISNVSGQKTIISTPDLVKINAIANGIELEIVEVAGVHIFILPRHSLDVLAAPPSEIETIIRDTLRRLLKNKNEVISELKIPDHVEDGTYFCAHEFPDTAWIGLDMPEVGFHVGILSNRLYIVLPKVPRAPSDRPVFFRGIDPNAYISSTLKESVRDEAENQKE